LFRENNLKGEKIMKFYPQYRMPCGGSCSLPRFNGCTARGRFSNEYGLNSIPKDCGCAILKEFLLKKNNNELQKIVLEFFKEGKYYVENLLDHFDPKRLSEKTIKKILISKIYVFSGSMEEKILEIAGENGYWGLIEKISRMTPKRCEIEDHTSGEDETSILYMIVDPHVVKKASALLKLKALKEGLEPDYTE
jgi:hypothetical protein